MVKNAVKHNADTVLVKGFANLLEAFVVAQTAVNFFVVDGIIAVSAALKKRIEKNCVNAHAFQMVNNIVNLIQTVALHKVIFLWRAAVTERINIVDNRFVNKTHNIYSFACEKIKCLYIVPQNYVLCKLNFCDII